MIKEAIARLIEGKSLSTEEAVLVMGEIMDGTVTPAQFGAFVTALRLKGETIDEIVGMAKTMRARAIPVVKDGPVVDTCGTGGDGASTFNISTTAAFVVAGAGIKVAKHHNRAASSQSGSADVLEKLGIKIDMNAEEIRQCLKEVGIGFMFAPAFHPAMKYASAPRREIGIRTVFNILGPLANPAGAEYQLIGVPRKDLGEKIAGTLQNLGVKHAFVVHALNGMDELSISGRSYVWEVGEDITGLYSYSVTPEDFGFKKARAVTMRGGMPLENADTLRAILAGEKSARRNVVVMNAAAAIAACGGNGSKAGTGGIHALNASARAAEEAIDSGRALNKLEELIKFTQNLIVKG